MSGKKIATRTMNAKKLNRKVHYWASLVIGIPVIIVIVTGIILQVKKEFDWIQPPTKRGVSAELALTFDQILAVVSTVHEVNLKNWGDINRLDVRPGKGIIKVRGENDWEVQIDSKTGEVLHVAVRRSDWIESIHDGSFFHKSFKLWVFLPSAVILAIMWGTGIYLFVLPYLAKRKKRPADRRRLMDGLRQSLRILIPHRAYGAATVVGLMVATGIFTAGATVAFFSPERRAVVKLEIPPVDAVQVVDMPSVAARPGVIPDLPSVSLPAGDP